MGATVPPVEDETAQSVPEIEITYGVMKDLEVGIGGSVGRSDLSPRKQLTRSTAHNIYASGMQIRRLGIVTAQHDTMKRLLKIPLLPMPQRRLEMLLGGP